MLTGFLDECGGDAASVVRDGDLDRAAALFRCELDSRARRLPCCLSLARRLDSVANGVADHVHERLGQALQNDSVELGVVPADQELDILPLGRGDVADSAGKRRGDRRERHHAHLDRGILQLAEQPATQVELVGHCLVAAAAIVADHVLEPAAVEHGLGHEVEQAINLLRRHADRTSIGGRRCRRRLGDDRRVGGNSSEGARQACGEVLEQTRRCLVVAAHVPAQGVCAAQQRFRELRRELSCRARLREDILHHMREISYRFEPDHRGATLDRVNVTEDRVDRVAIRAGALEREQGVDHAVEPFVCLVAKELDEFGFGVWFDDGHAARASRAKRTSTSRTPMSPESSRAAPDSSFE